MLKRNFLFGIFSLKNEVKRKDSVDKKYVKNKSSDIGHILRNIIYLELIRRGYEVYVGQLKDKEVDFVAINNEEIKYYQVSLTVLDENTLARELRPL